MSGGHKRETGDRISKSEKTCYRSEGHHWVESSNWDKKVCIHCGETEKKENLQNEQNPPVKVV